VGLELGGVGARKINAGPLHLKVRHPARARSDTRGSGGRTKVLERGSGDLFLRLV